MWLWPVERREGASVPLPPSAPPAPGPAPSSGAHLSHRTLVFKTGSGIGWGGARRGDVGGKERELSLTPVARTLSVPTLQAGAVCGIPLSTCHLPGTTLTLSA